MPHLPPPAELQNTTSHSPSGALLPETTQPTQSKRTSPENGHVNSTVPKRINALFREFGSNGQKEGEDMESVEGNTNEVEIGEHISEEQYEHYVGQRKSFGEQARCEVSTLLSYHISH